MIQEEKRMFLMELSQLIIEEWFELGIELLSHYKCHRCAEASCCHIACQLQESEFRDLALSLHLNFQEFYDKYCQSAPLGTYLKTPCPFLQMKKKATCTMHHVRPFMCRLYPISSMPGVVLNIDMCPLAKDIADDLNRVRGEVVASGVIPESSEYQLMYNKVIGELELLEAAPLDEQADKEYTEGMLNLLDDMAPEGKMKGELHQSVKTGTAIYRLLLEEKRNAQ